jgi:circadian clock protein KaiB
MATTSKRPAKVRTGAGAGKPKKRRSNTASFEGALEQQSATEPNYVLRLYVAGTTPRSVQAIGNVRAVCEGHLAGHYDLEVVDIYQQPGSAAENQIVAAPTLVKELPLPVRRMVGDLSDRAKLLSCFNLDPEGAPL